MTEYWAREEKVEAIQYTGTEQSLEEVLLWASRLYDDGVPLFICSHSFGRPNEMIPLSACMMESIDDSVTNYWQLAKPVEFGDYLVIDGLGELQFMSEREFTKRYYRRNP